MQPNNGQPNQTEYAGKKIAGAKGKPTLPKSEVICAFGDKCRFGDQCRFQHPNRQASDHLPKNHNPEDNQKSESLHDFEMTSEYALSELDLDQVEGLFSSDSESEEEEKKEAIGHVNGKMSYEQRKMAIVVTPNDALESIIVCAGQTKSVPITVVNKTTKNAWPNGCYLALAPLL